MSDELPMNETSHETHEAEPARWRVGVVSAARIRNALISEPVSDGAIVDVLRSLSSRLPAGFKAFAFVSAGDKEFDAGVAAAVVDSIASLAAFRDGSANALWHGYDILARVRFDEACDAKRLANEIAQCREQAQTCIELRGELQTARRRLALAAAIATVFAFAACMAIASVRSRSVPSVKQPSLEQQNDQRGKNGHEKPVSARGDAGEDFAILPGALLGVERFEAGYRDGVDPDARNARPRSAYRSANEPRVDGGHADDSNVTIGKVRFRPFASRVAKDGVLRVVHGAESSTTRAAAQNA
jgi:hypothetical protein